MRIKKRRKDAAEGNHHSTDHRAVVRLSLNNSSKKHKTPSLGQKNKGKEMHMLTYGIIQLAVLVGAVIL
ncbi:MAG: hypothetical protein CMI52_02825 [Parcubacteria group bacterium]|nr:hypothetical protein [Parcubacteria group bacterium]|tara:strand:+ start:462 stop:668 length:207 start_codon:yes stop_codon:yes gene_type:complete